MKAKALKPLTAVRVWWDDSMTLGGWKMATQDIGEVGRVVSIGYVVQSKPEVLVLTSSFGSNGAALSPVCIPWNSITRVDKMGKEWDRI